MKCYTVSEKGITAGVAISREPYPHVGVGDPQSQYNYRRVAVDAALVEGAANGLLQSCSYVLHQKGEDIRRAGYKLVPNKGDDDMALVKLEVHAPNGRSFYDLPRYTMTLANGSFSPPSHPRVATPVQLIVLRKGGEVTISVAEDVWTPPLELLRVHYDGTALQRMEKPASAPAA